MKVLAFDTSFDACSAAILDGETLCWRACEIIGRGHSEWLPVMVARGLAATGFQISDFDRIGVVIGPGAFAGVRVGLAFARGLCLGTGARAVGVTSLAALAASLGAAAQAAIIFDARRGQVYAGLHDANGAEILAPFVAAPARAAQRIEAARAAAAPLLLAGSGAKLVIDHMAPLIAVATVSVIDPAAVARLAARGPAPLAPPAPLYLRPPDATPSASGLFSGLDPL